LLQARACRSRQTGQDPGRAFRLTYVGGDTIRAQLELVKYPEIIKVMKQLEKEGFFWSEETPKANS